MKPKKNTSKRGFQKGCRPWNKELTIIRQPDEDINPANTIEMPKLKTIRRMVADKFNLVTTKNTRGVPISTPDCEGDSKKQSLILRPAPIKSKQESESAAFLEGMRLVDNQKMIEAWNGVFKCHRESLQCKEPAFDIAKETKWGMCWKMSFKCVKCDFETQEYKLYQEAENKKPGPNPAAANIGLAIGLQDTPVGNTRARLLMANMNIPPPTKTSMQRLSNIVSDNVTQLNKGDMLAKLKVVREVNENRGNEPNEINMEMDGRYNSKTRTECLTGHRDCL